MAIEVLQAKPQKLRAIEIIAPRKNKTPRGVLVQGQVLEHGKQVKVPESDAHDLVCAGQAKFLDESAQAAKK